MDAVINVTQVLMVLHPKVSGGEGWLAYKIDMFTVSTLLGIFFFSPCFLAILALRSYGSNPFTSLW